MKINIFRFSDADTIDINIKTGVTGTEQVTNLADKMLKLDKSVENAKVQLNAFKTLLQNLSTHSTTTMKNDLTKIKAAFDSVAAMKILPADVRKSMQQLSTIFNIADKPKQLDKTVKEIANNENDTRQIKLLVRGMRRNVTEIISKFNEHYPNITFKIVFDFDNPGVEESKPWLTNEGEMQPLEQGEDSGQGMVQEEPVSVETEMASMHEQAVEIKSEQHDENILSDENVQEVQTGETQELPWN